MKRIFSFLWTYLVDVVFFAILFGIGFYMKHVLTGFFQTVGEYQSNIQALQPGLANQSSSALLAVDPLITHFHNLVLKTFVLAMVVAPLCVYMLFVLNNSFLLSRKKQRHWKYFGIAFLLGLPLLGIFYLLMDTFFQSFGNVLYSSSALWMFIALLTLFFLLSYCWYTLVAFRAYGRFKNLRVLYKKAYVLLPVFLLFYVIHLFLLFFLVYIVVAIFTGSFLANQLWISLLLFLILLLFLEAARLWYSVLIEKYHIQSP